MTGVEVKRPGKGVLAITQVRKTVEMWLEGS